MSHETTDSDSATTTDAQTPEELVDSYEAELSELLADVEEPAAADDGFSLELAGLELGRRDFVKAGAATGLAGALSGCSMLGGGPETEGTPTDSNGGNGGQSAGADYHVPPGEHDEYYGFWSGGHSGEVRVVGMPSMREIRRIPVFQKDGALGYGHDQQTQDMLAAGGDIQSMAGHEWGDTHHPILSETDGDYDGRYLWINDKVSGRMARIDLT